LCCNEYVCSPTFHRYARTPERPLVNVLLKAGAIRFKSILLTAVTAAIIGAAQSSPTGLPAPRHRPSLWPGLFDCDDTGDLSCAAR